MYHKIKPEDLKHGLNYQIKKKNVHKKEVFVEKRVNMDKFFKDENFIIKDDFIDNIRVRDLSDDDIKKEGWIKIRDGYYKLKINEVEYYLAYLPDSKMCNIFFMKTTEHEGKQVPNRGDLFLGFLKNRSCLQIIMRMLGFKK
jgi:hypothetical protein